MTTKFDFENPPEDIIKSFREKVITQFPKGITEQEKTSLLAAINYNKGVNRWNTYFLNHGIKELSYSGGELNVLTEEQIITANQEAADRNKPFDRAWEFIARFPVYPMQIYMD